MALNPYNKDKFRQYWVKIDEGDRTEYRRAPFSLREQSANSHDNMSFLTPLPEECHNLSDEDEDITF